VNLEVDASTTRVAGVVDVLTRHGFLDPSSCRRIRRAMDAGDPEPAQVLDKRIDTDEDIRRAMHVEVDSATLTFLEGRLDEARPLIERFFRVQLNDREGASTLRYTAGGFFRRHRDWGRLPSWPGAARRRIAVVVFLTTSREADPSGTFAGGMLRLFAGDGAAPIDVAPHEGTLVAFPATMLHEVTEVHDGTRDSVVDWFY
jgi:predicted 2-oxoglutarate/Fe(II)-dependent dioxygenase YbiX